MFSLNPITGNLDEVGNSGGGGGGITSLIPDEGGAISSPDAVIGGMPAGSAQVIETVNQLGQLLIENRALMTRYVVNADATPGERGTFTDIQDAIDAAIIDGCLIANQKCGLIYCIGALPGFTIPEGAFITVKGVSNAGAGTSLLTGTTITSTITIEKNCVAAIEDIVSLCAAGDCLSVTADPGEGPLSLSISQSSFHAIVGQALDWQAGAIENLMITDCLFNSEFFVSSNGTSGLGTVNNSKFVSFAPIILQGSGGCVFTGCELADIELNQAAVCRVYNCVGTNSNSAEFSIHGTSNGIVYVNDLFCSITSSSPIPIINHSGTLFLGKVDWLSTGLTGTASRNIVGPNVTNVLNTQSMKGNVTYSRTVTATATCTKYDTFIWCNHAAAMSLSLTQDFANNQEITIKDQSLNASVNNITVSVPGGLIDGAATFVINQNGQTLQLKKLGVNYFIVDKPSPSALTATGFVVRAGTSWVARTLNPGVGIAITNATGSIGNPSISVVRGGFAWVNVTTSSTQQMIPNTAYFADNAATVTLNLPNGGTLGDTVKVVGVGAGGWTIAQPGTQYIVAGTQTTTPGPTGSLSSTAASDGIELVLSPAGWRATSMIGTYTAV